MSSVFYFIENETFHRACPQRLLEFFNSEIKLSDIDVRLKTARGLIGVLVITEDDLMPKKVVPFEAPVLQEESVLDLPFYKKRMDLLIRATSDPNKARRCYKLMTVSWPKNWMTQLAVALDCTKAQLENVWNNQHINVS